MVAVTLDLWNTLVVEGPSGLFRARAALWRETLVRAGLVVDSSTLLEAHTAALEAYKRAWTQNAQFTSPEATTFVLDHMGLTVDEDLTIALQQSFHDAGLASTIEVVDHAHELLHALSERGVRIGLICDIGLTPSTCMVVHLERLGLLPFFDVLSWSDEMSVYKPDGRIFECTLQALSAPAAEALHVGDRRRTDVAGAHAAGMATVRFRSVYDDPDPGPEADHVVDDLLEVLDLLDAVAPSTHRG